MSAMTAGIRRNWIQAVMKNVRPSTAPDVARSAQPPRHYFTHKSTMIFISFWGFNLPNLIWGLVQCVSELLQLVICDLSGCISLPLSLTDDHGTFSPLESLVRPDVTQDSPSSEASSVERDSAIGPKKSRARERRREGRSKTFDWAEFRPIAQALAQQRAQEAEGLQVELGELERSRRREERRRRYESVTGSTVEPPSSTEGGRMDYESGGGDGHVEGGEPEGLLSLEKQQKVEEVIEQHWQQVEKTPIREERRVPLPTAMQTRETAELEKLLESYKKGVSLTSL